MKLRKTLATAGATFLLSLSLSTPVLAQETYELKMAETWGPIYTILGDTSRSMAE